MQPHLLNEISEQDDVEGGLGSGTSLLRGFALQE